MSSIAGVSGNSSIQSAQRSPEAAMLQTGSKELDGNSDETGVSNVKPVEAPTVNTSGQLVGQIINIKA